MRILSCRCEIETYGKGSEKLAETEIKDGDFTVIRVLYEEIVSQEEKRSKEVERIDILLNFAQRN